MPDNHPLSLGAARSLALQNAGVFLMGARGSTGYWDYDDGLVLPRFRGPHSTSSILTPGPSAGCRAHAPSTQKTSVVFEPIIEPVILGPEADQHPGRLSVASNDGLLVFGFMQKPWEIVLDFG
jgi:hypothetical protein